MSENPSEPQSRRDAEEDDSDRPRGIPGWLAIEIAEKINFPPEDLEEIKAAIEECSQIDWDSWDLPSPCT